LSSGKSDEDSAALPIHEVNENEHLVLTKIIDEKYAVITLDNELRLLALNKIEQAVKFFEVKNRWQHNFISQPLLLPIKISLTQAQVTFVEAQTDALKKIGIVASVLSKSSIQVREFPALLRNKDVNLSVNKLLTLLCLEDGQELTNSDWQQAFASLFSADSYDNQQAKSLLRLSQQQLNPTFEQQLRLNSVLIDLTSSIRMLTNAT
jgi:DNA mismatch repair protein MutL